VAVPKKTLHPTITKRIRASQLGKVYDILGFYTPETIKAKILLKKTWQTQIAEIYNQWTSQLETLSTHQIDRCYSSKSDITNRVLHGFSDSSQEAYNGVVYLTIDYKDKTSSSAIVLSMSRVVPLKGLLIPRAELTAAHFLAKLLKYCAEILKVTEVHAWTDSAIVLCWLRKSLNTLKTFVHNRVNQIHNLIPTAQWKTPQQKTPLIC